jgi:hypothetical protein
LGLVNLLLNIAACEACVRACEFHTVTVQIRTPDEKKALHCCKALSVWLPDLDSNQGPAD